ncbi:hypothetical protein HDU93_007455 [Gonapodya sp. JEL0774]|nr:hypothetical protein HDU93_007455 [Gonapodya sp. JEL0774]
MSSSDNFDWSHTAFGYEPSTPLALVFLAFFAISGVVHSVQAFWFRSRVTVAIIIGCFIEVLGFGLRLTSKSAVRANPKDTLLFSIQFALIVLAPIFLAAAVYLLLSHIINLVGDQYSPMTRRAISNIFIAADTSAFLVQVIGACLILIPQPGSSISNVGLKVMIFGLAIQVVGIFAFSGVAVAFYVRASNVRGKWHVQMWSLFLAATLILIRNLYRMAEYWQGFDNAIALNESLLYILDAGLMSALVVLFHVVHPGKVLKGDNLTDTVTNTETHEMDIEEMTRKYVVMPQPPLEGASKMNRGGRA